MSTSITTDIAFCQKLLKAGKLVAIPTETVYGLAANILDVSAIKSIFEMKGRPMFNPLIVHIHSFEQLSFLVEDVPKNALKLAEAFWPGSLTLILSKKPEVPDVVTAGKSTVGIRMPNHPMTLELLRGLPFPIAAPSANPFTRISPTSAEHVASYFGNKIPAILDGGPCKIGLESTIVGFNGECPIVYRKGGTSVEAIEALVGKVQLVTKDDKAPLAPGMLAKHYSPNTKLIISTTVEESLKRHHSLKIGVISFYKDYENAAVVRTLSKQGDTGEAARNLFTALHELDQMSLDLIVADKFPEEGLGASINDRLQRAAN
ncbi:MAG: L-threonylcarbamoyladenylate synthase [Maribacter sp.]